MTSLFPLDINVLIQSQMAGYRHYIRHYHYDTRHPILYNSPTEIEYHCQVPKGSLIM